MRVSFTALQAGEIAHKLSIVAEEADLQDSYGLTKSDAECAAEDFGSVGPYGGDVVLTLLIAECILGELDNSCDIALSNMDTPDRASRADLAAYISSMRSAQRKLRRSFSI